MLAANDEMALGEIAAITESGRQDILLTIDRLKSQQPFPPCISGGHRLIVIATKESIL